MGYTHCVIGILGGQHPVGGYSTHAEVGAAGGRASSGEYQSIGVLASGMQVVMMCSVYSDTDV